MVLTRWALQCSNVSRSCTTPVVGGCFREPSAVRSYGPFLGSGRTGRATIEETNYYNLRQWIRFFLLEDFVEDLTVPVAKVVQKTKYFTFEEAIDTTSTEGRRMLGRRDRRVGMAFQLDRP